MTPKQWIGHLTQIEGLNFLLTNRIPRRALTRFMGRFSKVRHPLVRDASLALFRLFSDDLRLHEARKDRFESLHDCFVRELKDGARTVDSDPRSLVSPCDAVVGAHGRIQGTELLQAKGFSYTLEELLHDPELVRTFHGGRYVTLRLKAEMYHHFHAPHDARLLQVRYLSGDTWNVNPIALRRIERLYCRNERAVLHLRLEPGGQPVALVAIAAVLVASIRLRFLDVRLHLGYRGPAVIPCDHQARKGEALGHFEHGSTIVLFAPGSFEPCPGIAEGTIVRMGQPLLRLPLPGA